jgi:uncharacterized protein
MGLKDRFKNRRIRYLGMVLGLSAIALGFHSWFPTQVLPYMLLSHHNYAVEASPSILSKFGAKAETVRFQSQDKVETVGWWIPTQTPNQSPTLIVLHNLGGTRQDHLERMLPLWQREINLLLLDLRSHGQSGGEFFTYGYHEWQDVTAAINNLEKHHGKLLQRVTVLGISAGGTVAIAAAAHDRRIHGLITIGTFADLEATIEQQTPWLPQNWRDRSMASAEQLAKFSIAATSPVQQIRQVTVPVLIAHAEQDDYIPFANGQQLFQAAHAPKQFYAIAQANHATMLDRDGQGLRDRIFQFCTALQAR